MRPWSWLDTRNSLCNWDLTWTKELPDLSEFSDGDSDFWADSLSQLLAGTFESGVALSWSCCLGSPETLVESFWY